MSHIRRVCPRSPGFLTAVAPRLLLRRTDGLAYVAFTALWRRTFALLLLKRTFAHPQYGRVLLLFAAHWGDDDPRVLRARNPA